MTKKGQGAPLAPVEQLLSGCLLVDVTRFSSALIRTGVERVIGALAQVAESYPLVPFVTRSRDEIDILSPDYFALVRAFFAKDSTGFDSHRSRYHENRTPFDVPKLRLKLLAQPIATVNAKKAAALSRAILAWNYTFESPNIDFYFDRLEDALERVHFLGIDFLVWTDHESFPRWHESVGMTRYLMLLRRAHNICFISKHVEDTFQRRIARGWSGRSSIAYPGCDALGQLSTSTVRADCSFAVVGTIEPRKMSLMILDVAERMAKAGRQFSLLFLGGLSGLLTPDEAARFKALESGIGPVRWLPHQSDEQLRRHISEARALIYLSTGEGYGAPPTEALSLGVPCIVSENLPCLEAIGSGGIVKIQCTDPTALEAAMSQFMDMEFAAKKRAEIDPSKLPTWRGFATQLVEWALNGSQRAFSHRQMLEYRQAYVELATGRGNLEYEDDSLAAWYGRALQEIRQEMGAGQGFAANSLRTLRGESPDPAEASSLTAAAAHHVMLARMERHATGPMNDPVEWLYWLSSEYLGRALTKAELSTWMGNAMRLSSPISAIASFAGCDEALAKRSDPLLPLWLDFVREWARYEIVLKADDLPVQESVLRDSFRQLLGREPDHEAWFAHLQHQVSTRDTMTSFLLSDEHLNMVSQLWAYGWALSRLGVSIAGLDPGVGGKASSSGTERRWAPVVMNGAAPSPQAT